MALGEEHEGLGRELVEGLLEWGFTGRLEKSWRGLGARSYASRTEQCLARWTVCSGATEEGQGLARGILTKEECRACGA